MRLLPVTLFTLCLIAPATAQLPPPNHAGVAMGHVHLNVSDIEQHRQIWIDHFDAVPLEREGLSGVKLPNMLLLFRQREPTGSSPGTVMDHFGLKVRSRAEVLERWRAAGLEVQAEFNGVEGFPNAYLGAPDGIRIELQEDVNLSAKAAGHQLHWILPNNLELRTWYLETFSVRGSKRGRLDTADLPGMNLSFMAPFRTGPDKVETKGRAIDHIGFEVRNLADFCKQLEAKGIRFDEPYRENPETGVATAFLTDPSGVYVELTEGWRQY